MEAGFRILEHPSDVGFEAWGETLSDVFRQSVLALLSVIVPEGTVDRSARRTVKLDASDHEQLLVRLLSEVLFCIDAEQFLPAQLVIEELRGTSLRGILVGERVDAAKHSLKIDVKAVTYHQLSIMSKGGVTRARVFVDL
jgi:SHS2 domain-containing protein